MSAIGDGGIISQLKKGQGETNERLERIAAAQEHTNELLRWLVEQLAKAEAS